MSFPDLFQNRLCLPIIAAPLFLASGPELVLACCRSGIVGTFPAKNQRTLAGFEDWLIQISDGLAHSEAATGSQPAPFGVNLIVHRTNRSLEQELDLCVKYRVPLIITSLGAVPRSQAELEVRGQDGGLQLRGQGQHRLTGARVRGQKGLRVVRGYGGAAGA